MNFVGKHRQFSKLVGGLLALGLGQSFLGNYFFTPVLEDKAIYMGGSILGGLAFLLGSGLLGNILFRLLKKYNQQNRLVKLFFYCLGISIVAGFVMGLLGQLLYDYTSIGYIEAKQTIWGITSILQVLIRLTGFYILITYIQGRAFDWKAKEFRLFIIMGVVAATVSVGFSLWLPSIAFLFQYLLDTAVVIGPVYYYLIRKKE